MRIIKHIIIVGLLLLPVGGCLAQLNRLEIGLQGGAGFYITANNSIDLGNGNTYTRTQLGCYGKGDASASFPVMDVIGAQVRYRFDNRWAVALQTHHQRLFFSEKYNSGSSRYYYNTAWHLDVTGEYHFLEYGDYSRDVSLWSPYVFLGIGTTFYDEQTSYGGGGGDRDDNGKHLYTINWPASISSLKAALYVPVGVGVKVRLNAYCQLQASVRYHLYFLDSNLAGGTKTINFKDGKEHEELRDGGPGVGYDQLPKSICGDNHSVIATIGVIFNFGTTDPSQSSAGWKTRKHHSCMCADY